MKSNNYRVTLMTLTPLFIGSDEGSDLSPTTDFIFDKGVVKIIDQRKFEILLSSDVNLINEFVSEVKSKSYSFNLKSFIENRLNTSIDNITKETVEVEGLLGSNTIATFITTLGKPYIPGSTLKGAVRTGIIYNFLIDSSEGKNIVDKLLHKATKSFKELQDLLAKKQNVRLNNDEFKKVKALNNYKSNEKEFSKLYNEWRLFKDRLYGHDFRHVQISDTETFKSSDTKIAELPRTYLTIAQDKTSQWKQLLKENISTTFSLNIKPEIKDDFLSRINSNSLNEMVSLLNSFSKDVIEFELNMYNAFSKNKVVESKLKYPVEFHDSLRELIERSDNKYAVIRIGGGKTYFDNSIGLALYKKDPKAFKEFRKLLGFWKHRSGSRSFIEEDSPITRTFYSFQNELYPIGWVVLFIDQQKEYVDKHLGLFERLKGSQKMTAETTTPIELLKQKFKVTKLKSD